ncbi:MAG: hypothetical protein RI958_862 [Actinomycetota bacterium]|jgi:hypothetical protein
MSITPPPPPTPSGPARGTGGKLVSSAWQALRHDHELISLPVVGGLAALAGIAPLLVFALLMPASAAWASVVLFVLIAFVAAIITTFFAVALAAGAHERMSGGDPSVRSACATAWKRKRGIVTWALLSTTVGLLLQALEDKIGGIAGKLVGALGGTAWAVASYFTIPIIAANDVGAVEALKLSSETVRRRWRNAARVELRLGLYMLGLVAAAIVGGVVVVALASVATVLGIIVGVVLLLAFLTALLVFGAVSAYAKVALYRYASGMPTPGFDESMLAVAVSQKA